MIVGIDFGTSTSEIAYTNEEGLPVVIPNHLGEVVTPSVVYMDEHHQPVVGEAAREKLLLEPQNTVIEIKRLLGTSETITIRDKVYRPVEIASYIMAYLVECASKHLGQPVTRAVITVPAFSTDAQRRATITAGELAGLSVERLINEPTAASLDYGVERRADCNHLLVYDFGGGTFDVTVLELFEGVLDVNASAGNNQLGGLNIDERLINHMVTHIKKKNKINIVEDLQAATRLKKAAEACKIELSMSTVCDVELPFLSTDKKGNPVGYSEHFTREVFNGLINDLIISTREQVDTVLNDALLKPDQIDFVLLVGGTTKIPYVREFLETELGFTVKSHQDPVLSVVRGAAIEGGIIEGRYNEAALVLTDVAPYSLSTEVLRRGALAGTYCDILIKRNKTIPTSVSKIYQTAHDHQSAVAITVYQGESEDPDENILLGDLTLKGIPKAKAGKEDIKITFSYDLNGLLVVEGEILSNGKSLIAEINTSNSAGEINPDDWVHSTQARKYRSVINKGEKILQTNLDDPDLFDDIQKTLVNLKRGLVLEQSAQLLDTFKDELLDLYSEV